MMRVKVRSGLNPSTERIWALLARVNYTLTAELGGFRPVLLPVKPHEIVLGLFHNPKHFLGKII